MSGIEGVSGLRITFIVGQAAVGGIETYCLRMCRELHRRGHQLDVWFVKPRGNKALADEFRAVARVRFLSRIMPVPVLALAPPIPADCDLVFTTGRLSLIFGALAMRPKVCPPLVAGVFSQWEYAGVVDDYKSQISQKILDQIGWRNLVFCTEGCRTFHLKALGDRINAALVSPLLVQLPQSNLPRPKRRKTEPLRIVSVGSFTPFKTYNFTLPAVLAELRNAGIAIEWMIFGDGVERPRIERAIAEAGVADIIKLAGPLDYAHFADEVSAADLYIGAGTTLIEASALGVPSLVALDDNPEATSPGFFADREGIFTSDQAEGDTLRSFGDLIRHFAGMTNEGHAALSERSKTRARAYSIETAEQEVGKIINHAIANCVRVDLATRLHYSLGVIREVVRVLLGRGAYRVR